MTFDAKVWQEILDRGPTADEDGVLLGQVRNLWCHHKSSSSTVRGVKQEDIDLIAPWLEQAHPKTLPSLWAVACLTTPEADRHVLDALLGRVRWPEDDQAMSELWQGMMGCTEIRHPSQEIELLEASWWRCLDTYGALGRVIPKHLVQDMGNTAISLAFCSASHQPRTQPLLNWTVQQGLDGWCARWATAATHYDYTNGVRLTLDTLLLAGVDVNEKHSTDGLTALEIVARQMMVTQDARDNLLDDLLSAGADWEPLRHNPDYKRAWARAQCHPAVRSTLLEEAAAPRTDQAGGRVARM